VVVVYVVPVIPQVLIPNGVNRAVDPSDYLSTVGAVHTSHVVISLRT